jgi:hypothetical protein
LQGLPACPINLETLRTRLPEIKCWGLPHLCKNINLNNDGATGNYNNNITNPNLTNTASATTVPLNHKFHRRHKKMPAFRGRRGWCGCFQVSRLCISCYCVNEELKKSYKRR